MRKPDAPRPSVFLTQVWIFVHCQENQFDDGHRVFDLAAGIETVQQRHADVKHDPRRDPATMALGSSARPNRDDTDDFAFRLEEGDAGFPNQSVVVGEHILVDAVLSLLRDERLMPPGARTPPGHGRLACPR